MPFWLTNVTYSLQEPRCWVIWLVYRTRPKSDFSVHSSMVEGVENIHLLILQQSHSSPMLTIDL